MKIRKDKKSERNNPTAQAHKGVINYIYTQK